MRKDKQELIYFQLNNWFEGDDYPDAEPFLSWLGDDSKLIFLNEDWVNENKLCVSANFIDMSISFRITSTKEWVEKNCPELLTTYQEFIRVQDKDENIKDRFGYDFLEYSNENIGVKLIDDE